MPPAQPAASWAALHDELVRRVLALSDGATLTVDAPDLARPTSPRAGFVGRLLGTRHVMLAPWVRLQRLDDHLRGETLRGQRSRGGFPMSRDEAEALTVLGWHLTRVEESADFVRWWPDDVTEAPYLPPANAQAAAQAALQVLREVYGAGVGQVRLTSSGSHTG